MKKITQLLASIICIVFITHTAFSQIEYQLDSIQRFEWNTNTNDFKMYYRQYFEYDNGGTKETYGIDEILNGTVWDPSLRYTKTYNGDNNVIEKIADLYDSDLDIWNASTKDFYTYDASQNVILIEDFYSSDDGITWTIPRGEDEMVYNLDNLETELTSRYYNTSTMVMVDLGQITTSYNGFNKAEEITKFWSSSDNLWLYHIKNEYTYDGDLPIQIDTFYWLGSDWNTQAQGRSLKTYDGNLLVESILQSWNSSGSFWENNFRTTQAFDANGNKIQNNTYDWDDNTSTWVNINQELWYWSEAGAILSVEEENKLSINIYPNPTTDYFTISNVNENATIAMFDVLGKRVGNYSLEANQKSKIYTNQLGSGLYFLKISSDTGTISKKLIVK